MLDDMLRKIIRIDEEKCNGCELCIPNCPEGAIQILDGKARLVGDLFCDGLGACLGHCPQGAITVEEREAEPYNERVVMQNIVRQGSTTIGAHLQHLSEHGEDALLKEALEFLEENSIPVPPYENKATDGCCGGHNQVRGHGHGHGHSHGAPGHQHHQGGAAHAGGGCPGSKTLAFSRPATQSSAVAAEIPSELTHWPVQMHLINPHAPHFRGSDMVVAADCSAYALGGFHSRFLKGKTLGICCPKLDSNKEIYSAKLTALIDQSKINSLSVMIMEVPCCRGLLTLAMQAAQAATRKIPVKCSVVGVQGQVLHEEELQPS